MTSDWLKRLPSGEICHCLDLKQTCASNDNEIIIANLMHLIKLVGSLINCKHLLSFSEKYDCVNTQSTLDYAFSQNSYHLLPFTQFFGKI